MSTTGASPLGGITPADIGYTPERPGFSFRPLPDPGSPSSWNSSAGLVGCCPWLCSCS
ncbi:hypothetical protein NITHO_360013 [Nitrolancea hollandica Lb]|uniref:Uncharacterized protein n=1 Tax=Nitrolancea hollandica Lb TaxID=1129897 RepID=I4EIS0_9BACT|nr:hypothetical protein NITHO_360013 [Nitrolancea hollandica Lb]